MLAIIAQEMVAGEIQRRCAAAGAPELAAGFIAEGATTAEVRAALAEHAAAGWDRAVARVNARLAETGAPDAPAPKRGA